jgi:uncharacterized membrane protein YgdD (TMEM256/DUF423 family)
MKASPLLPGLAAANAVLALTFGTFAAHGIKDPQARDWIMTGVLFQLPHVAAVFGLLAWRDNGFVRTAALGLALGSLIFAGNLYALALGAPRWIAAFAPIGGTLMMFSWLGVLAAAFVSDRLK